MQDRHRGPAESSGEGLLAQGQERPRSAGRAWRWEPKSPQRHQTEGLSDVEQRKREEKAASFPQDGKGKRTISVRNYLEKKEAASGAVSL